MSWEFIDRQRRRRSRSQQIDKAEELTQRVIKERRAPCYGQEYLGQKIVGANSFLVQWMEELALIRVFVEILFRTLDLPLDICSCLVRCTHSTKASSQLPLCSFLPRKDT